MRIRDCDCGRGGVQQRYMLMDEVTRPRSEEAACMHRGGWPHKYDYTAEPFRVLRKEFWPLHDHAQRQRHFLPTIRHENDGLILQARPPHACMARYDATLQ